MMKLLAWISVFLTGLLFGEEMEVRRYAVGKQLMEEAYWEAMKGEDGDPFDEEVAPKIDEEWLGAEVGEAGFESRFLREGMKLRDCLKWLEASGIEGAAVYDVEGEFLILKAGEKAHRRVESLVLWKMLGSVRTKVSIYEVSGVGLEDRSGFWAEVPAGAKLLGSLSCVAIPGQTFEARTEDGGIDLEGEVQIDVEDQFVENRMTLKVDLGEGGFFWKTGFEIPGGVRWAQEVGSVDGKSGLVAVVRQDRVAADGMLLDEAILKEEGGAFLRKERLERLRWKDREEEPPRDLTKPFQVYEAPRGFSTIAFYGHQGAGIFGDGKYSELDDFEGVYWDLRKILEENGLTFREGDFVVYGEERHEIYVRLSEINLELFELILESAGAEYIPRMIRVEFAQVEGEDLRKGRVLKKVGLTMMPGQVGTVGLGENLMVEVESQIDGNDELIEFRATLSENGEVGKTPSFKTGGILRNGRPVAIQRGFSDGGWKTWVVTGRVLALEVEIDEFLKARGEENE